MYIGSTGERGLHHLVYEVVDNAVDEALAGYADTIVCTLMADGGVRVVDNGRGIPVDRHPVEKRPAVEVVMTTLHAGGKFDGIVLRRVRWAARGRASRWSTRCRRGSRSRSSATGSYWNQPTTTSRAPTARCARAQPTPDTGTTITFWADPAIFESTVYSYETLARRLQEMAFLNAGLSITLRDERGEVPAETRLPLQGRAGGLRQAPQRDQAADPRLGDPLHRAHRGRGRQDGARGRDAVELHLRRVGLHLREHDQHPRRRHPRRGLPGRADHGGQQVRPRPEGAAGEGRQPHR